ncbi:hypothetical protein [uncultured Parvibaculum sp.]|uniref:hypothetical protein n=1 Tax=uncultured Parvibaculum sp. TaxID=291828 RepID=UPI0030EDDCF6
MRASGVSNPLDRIRHRLDSWLFEDMSTGRFMLDRAIFTDPELFDLEMKHIFERNWVFLARRKLSCPTDRAAPRRASDRPYSAPARLRNHQP